MLSTNVNPRPWSPGKTNRWNVMQELLNNAATEQELADTLHMTLSDVGYTIQSLVLSEQLHQHVTKDGITRWVRTCDNWEN